jgi:hypothetical protein
MADITTDTTAADDSVKEPEGQDTGREAKPDVPPEVKAALRKANKEAEALRLKLKEYEDRDKTETEKLAERAATAERERDEAKAAALRLRIAAKHGISDEDADLFLTGTDEATLAKQAERLAQRAEDRKKHGNHVPREGTNTNPGSSTEREFARNLFAGD